MKNNSELTFNKLTKDLGFVKVWWNGKLIFDDTCDLPLVDLNTVYEEYGNRYVYSMKIKVVESHHCEVKIKGEKDKDYTPRQLVVGPYHTDNDGTTWYEHDLVDSKDVIIDEELKREGNEKLFDDILNEVAKQEYFRYTYPTAHIYKVRVENIDIRYGWIRQCKELYILK